MSTNMVFFKINFNSFMILKKSMKKNWTHLVLTFGWSNFANSLLPQHNLLRIQSQKTIAPTGSVNLWPLRILAMYEAQEYPSITFCSIFLLSLSLPGRVLGVTPSVSRSVFSFLDHLPKKLHSIL